MRVFFKKKVARTRDIRDSKNWYVFGGRACWYTHCCMMEKQVTLKMLSSPESGRASPFA